MATNHNNDNEVMKMTMTFWLSKQAAGFFDEGIQNTVVQYKCFNKHGSYVEKREMWVEYENKFVF